MQPRRAPNQRPTLTFTAAAPQEAPLECGGVTRLLPHGPLLIAATERGGLRAFDARAGARHVWTLAAPVAHGVCTSVAAVHDAPALCTGTSRGLMHLWDLRFQVHPTLDRCDGGQQSPVAFARTTALRGVQPF